MRSRANHRDTAIGAGVGVPLGVIILTAVAWALFERRGRLHHAKATSTSFHGFTAPAPPSVSNYASSSIQPLYTSSAGSASNTKDTSQVTSPGPVELNQSITELNGHNTREHELQ